MVYDPVTKRHHRRTLKENHISVTSEPDGQYRYKAIELLLGIYYSLLIPGFTSHQRQETTEINQPRWLHCPCMLGWRNMALTGLF
jgi:hypothetical protein